MRGKVGLLSITLIVSFVVPISAISSGAECNEMSSTNARLGFIFPSALVFSEWVRGCGYCTRRVLARHSISGEKLAKIMQWMRPLLLISIRCKKALLTGLLQMMINKSAELPTKLQKRKSTGLLNDIMCVSESEPIKNVKSFNRLCRLMNQMVERS